MRQVEKINSLNKSFLNNHQAALADFLNAFAKSRNAKSTSMVNFLWAMRNDWKNLSPEKLNHSVFPFKHFNKDLKFKHVFDIDLDRLRRNYGQLKDLKFDFSFCITPFHLERQPSVLNEKIRVFNEFNFISEILKYLSDDGILFTLLPPSVFYQNSQGEKTLKLLSDNGIYCNFLLQGLNGNGRNEQIFNDTSVNPVLVGFQKVKTEKRFVANIESILVEYKKGLISNFNRFVSGDTISQGLWIKNASLKEIQIEVYKEKIVSLGSQYSNIKHISIGDLSDVVNLSKNELKQIPNSVFIPKLGTSLITSDIESLTIKYQNVIQVVLKNDLVLAEYIELFFISEYGKELRKSLLRGSTIPSISKTSLLEGEIPVPSIEQQKILIEARNKLNELESRLLNLKSELGLKPNHANKIIDKFDGMLKPFKEVTAEDDIFEFIKSGETKHIEFKSSFQTDIEYGGKIPPNTLREAAMKEICAFINTKGGTLLIGITDNGDILGIEEDNFKSRDKYLLTFKDVFKEKIGKEWIERVDFNIVEVKEKLVLRVDCTGGKKACLLNDTVYVRLGPSAEPLGSRQLLEYSAKRWVK